MRHDYYIGTGPQADMLIAHCEAMKSERALVIGEVNEKFAPGKVIITADGVGICFTEAADLAHRRWLKSLGAIDTSEGMLYVYEPKPVNPKGRELHRLLTQDCMHFDASDYIVDACGMRVYDSGGSLSPAQSEAAYIGKRVFITVPCGDGLMPPAPSAWLRRVSEEEFVEEWRKSC